MELQVLRTVKRYRMGMIFLSFILGIYLIGTLPKDFLHQLIHFKEFAQLHNYHNESDPCHIHIYHQNFVEGCHHDSHITEKESCGFEHVWAVEQHTLNLSWILSDSNHEKIFFNVLNSNFEEIKFPHCSSRAPPVAVDQTFFLSV
jgi:hypothetical protein